MIAAAERATLVVDSSKFGQRALTHLCSLDAVDEIVTDDGVSEEWVRTLESKGIAVDVVEVGSKARAGG
jgi:DeoR family transcriptional regulator of aga operon